ncbi:hypothetical protein [uncultured Flavobacterium sp.]|uniref:hypothetical protein n=1 Tax=uncultured Flavobacterium sp. TaxID=165435 RepID=UPI002598A401|nr:hypothetical protein [uncultured Flavobacterium sp.]
MSNLNWAFDVVPNIKTTLMKWAVVLRRMDKIIKAVIAFCFSEWRDWTPTEFSASGTMTFTKTADIGGKYLKVGNTIIYSFFITGTTGGVASNEVYINLPFLPNEGFRESNGVGVAVINDGAILMGFSNLRNTRTDLVVRKYDVSNYALAAGVTIRCVGIYECADLPENNIV